MPDGRKLVSIYYIFTAYVYYLHNFLIIWASNVPMHFGVRKVGPTCGPAKILGTKP